MRIVYIRKRRGAYRKIYVPDKKEKLQLRKILQWLNSVVKRECSPYIVHGFVPGRNPVTNAMQHVGFSYTLSMDLQDFFDHVRPRHVLHMLHRPNQTIVHRHCFIDGAARQGLPTSPALSNLAMAGSDKVIEALARKYDRSARYTRYADDLTISFNRPNIHTGMVNEITNILYEAGFPVNERKTELQSSKGGRRVITGVSVDDQGVYAPRKVRRKLRAALHQQNQASARGLGEWCALKTPRKWEQLEAESEQHPVWNSLWRSA